MLNKFLGIDLGTTYSCASYVADDGKPAVIKNAEGELITASVVFFESPNNIVVGGFAKESSMLYPDQVVSYAKQSIGRTDKKWLIDSVVRTPEEVSSYILRKLVNDANSALRAENKIEENEFIRDVVITCPAYFGINERHATKKAGEIAGLNVMGIINEPTAAAITYGITGAKRNQIVLVYDLGGGTFDATLIDIKADEIKVICTGGDDKLGGKLWDDRIVSYLASEFQRQSGINDNILSDPETHQELLIIAERAKKMLSAREKAPIAINYKGIRARVELTRVQFEAFTQDLLERTIFLTKEIFSEAHGKGYILDSVDEILLVGGSTRMPQVINRIESVFGKKVESYDPDEAVAKGAALFAAQQNYFTKLIDRAAYFTGEDSADIKKEVSRGQRTVEEVVEQAQVAPDQVGVSIVNVTGRSFGTIAYENTTSEDRKEVLYNLILKNSELPITKARQFFTVVPNQRMVNIQVLESNANARFSNPKDGMLIGQTVLELPAGLPAGSPLEIQFNLDESGLLEVFAKEKSFESDVSARFETVDNITYENTESARQRLEQSMIL